MDVSQYLDVFIDETAEHMQNLSDCIMSLENDPDDKDTINEIFRAAHSLKGMAGTMGFKRMQHLTHDMEDMFQEVRNDNIKVTSEMIDILFECLDAIEGYADNIKATSDEGTEDNQILIDKLNAFLNGKAAPAPASKEEAPAAETEEAAATDTSDADEMKFKLIELGDSERGAIKAAEDAGKTVYGMTVYINENCLLKAARAFLVFKAIEDFGDIVVYSPSSQDIEDEKFEFDFSMYIALEGSIEDAAKEAKDVSEIEKVVYEKVTYNELLMKAVEEEEAATAPEEPAKEEAEAPKAEVTVAEKPQQAPAAAPAAQQQAGGGKKPAAKAVTSRTVRVDIEKLDALMNQVSELIIAKNSLVSLSSGEDGQSSQTFHDQIEYLERITTSLHESVMKVRMVPIESVVNKFPRMIRDLSRQLGKKMELYMSGEETELDRTVVDQIGDPLQHLLRNSADHGLESAELRKERGKPEVGTIYLNAYQEGNNVIIEVGDDGNGIDTERVKAKAIERGIVSADAAESLSQKEIIDFLFMPSFSMAKQITDISGRGVGLDVVKSNIEALGGDVEVKSTLGEGSKFTVRLPLTLAIIQALMVEVRDEKFAIALGSIMTIESVPQSDIKYVQAKEVLHIRGMVIPIIRLDEVLDSEPLEDKPEILTVVIVKKGDRCAGLVVDNLMGQQEIVIKSLGHYINNNKIISGATILGDGEVALILDTNQMI